MLESYVCFCLVGVLVLGRGENVVGRCRRCMRVYLSLLPLVSALQRFQLRSTRDLLQVVSMTTYIYRKRIIKIIGFKHILNYCFESVEMIYYMTMCLGGTWIIH